MAKIHNLSTNPATIEFKAVSLINMYPEATNEAILKMCKEKYPTDFTKTGTASIAWYKTQLKKTPHEAGADLSKMTREEAIEYLAARKRKQAEAAPKPRVLAANMTDEEVLKFYTDKDAQDAEIERMKAEQEVLNKKADEDRKKLEEAARFAEQLAKTPAANVHKPASQAQRDATRAANQKSGEAHQAK